MTLSDYNIINNFRQGFRDAFKDVVGFEEKRNVPYVWIILLLIRLF